MPQATMQASPQNPLLGLLARALYKARDVMSPAPGSLADEKGFNIADLLLGDAPEEVENWSFGNAPFAIPPLARIPQAKTTVVERDGKKERKNRAFMAADAAAFAPLGTADNLAQAGAKGAIRIMGHPQTVATHAVNAPTREKIQSIASKGLYAPSIGLHQASGNAFAPYSPAYVFRAGALDRPFPDEAPSGIFNRDAYVWNPARESSRSIREQWPGHNTPLAKAGGDARLTQFPPDKGSHTAAILASPSFRDLQAWEESPLGRGLLTENLQDAPMKTKEDYVRAWRDKTYNVSEDRVHQALLQFPALQKSGLDLSTIEGSVLGDTYGLARKAPSQMGELKIYAPSVPTGPNEASIYLPDKWSTKVSGEAERSFLDQGYQVYGPQELSGLAGEAKVDGDLLKRRLDLLAPASGLAPPSPEEARRMWDDLQTRGPSMVGAPGLKLPAQPFDQLNTAANHYGFPEGHPAIEIFNDPSRSSIEKLQRALGVDQELQGKKAFLAIGQKLGLTEKESLEVFNTWMVSDETAPQLFKKALK